MAWGNTTDRLCNPTPGPEREGRSRRSRGSAAHHWRCPGRWRSRLSDTRERSPVPTTLLPMTHIEECYAIALHECQNTGFDYFGYIRRELWEFPVENHSDNHGNRYQNQSEGHLEVWNDNDIRLQTPSIEPYVKRHRQKGYYCGQCSHCYAVRAERGQLGQLGQGRHLSDRSPSQRYVKIFDVTPPKNN